jgi:hypothetical protein
MSAWKPKFCQWCGKAIKRPGGGKDAKKYCGKPCYFSAVRAGTQQFRGRCHDLSAALADWAFRWDAQRPMPRKPRPRKSKPSCEACGKEVNGRASRFCSYACNKAWRGARACRCGAIVENATAFGNAPMCLACKRQARRARRRIAKDTRKRVRNGGGYWNSEVKALGVFKRDRWRCYLCKCKCSKRYDPLDPRSATVDHVYPVAHGGDHDWHNVRTACALCNAKKSDTITGQMQLVFE